jgi:hypothetical protein
MADEREAAIATFSGRLDETIQIRAATPNVTV